MMARPGLGPLIIALGLVALAPRSSSAQEPRLVGRLPAAVRAQVDSLLDAARAAGLPTEPLVDRALEGAAKGAPPERILVAVTRLRDELRQARSSLGAEASPAELAAGASALRAGASSEDLARLRELRMGQPLTMVAAVLADLVSAGVPSDTAIAAVFLLARDAADADYVSFRRNVQRDIALGASPAAALGVRLRAATEMADAPAQGGQTGTGVPRKQRP
jgi:hypothetical protein